MNRSRSFIFSRIRGLGRCFVVLFGYVSRSSGMNVSDFFWRHRDGVNLAHFDANALHSIPAGSNIDPMPKQRI